MGGGLAVCALPGGAVGKDRDGQNARPEREGGGVQPSVDAVPTLPGQSVGASHLRQPRLRHLLPPREGQEGRAAGGGEHEAVDSGLELVGKVCMTDTQARFRMGARTCYFWLEGPTKQEEQGVEDCNALRASQSM